MLSIEQLKKEYEEYFKKLEEETLKAFKIAEKARKKGLDPKPEVEIKIARDLSERVLKLISIVAPELEKIDINIPELIKNLERQYSPQDWRVALKLSEIVAKKIYEISKDRERAIEIGLRLAEAYVTLGIASAPIEGIIRVKIKKRLDGKEYLAIYVAGPIRTAGGTACAIVTLFADYLRKQFGLLEWDPTEDEKQRYILEVFEYDRVKKLQYKPSREELEFIFSHLPIEVSGEPTEEQEVSAYKDLPRIETNRIRGGMALVIAEGLALKAKKIAKKLKKWGKDFGLDHWNWLNDLVKLQEEIKAKGKVEANTKDSEKKKEEKIKPNWKYTEEIVAGRPIFALPLTKGGFRLRYGKSRTNGLESSTIHPAASVLTYSFLVTGTQIRPERPGKSSAISFSTELYPPVVKLKDGSVIKVKTVKKAKKILNKVEKILFLGDILINFGNFLNNGHIIVPSGYVEEWWILEFEKAAQEKIKGFEVKFDMFKPRAAFKIVGIEKLSKFLKIKKERLEKLIRYPLKHKPSLYESLKISILLDVPLHPEYTYFWKDISSEDFKKLAKFILEKGEYEVSKEVKIGDKTIPILRYLSLPNSKEYKEILENLLIPHKIVNEKIVLEGKEATSLYIQLWKVFEKQTNIDNLSGENGLDLVNQTSLVKIRDMSGIYVGIRMGRPEKAKLRRMKGKPHMLFPVGKEGGRMRNFMEAVKIGKISADLPLLYCEKCHRFTLYKKCEFCGSETIQYYKCPKCGQITKLKVHCDVPTKPFTNREINPKEYLELAIKNLKISPSEVPSILKGVKGLSNRTKIPERLEKGILRAKYGLYVFRDGTIRLDAIEMPIIYFRPKELKYVTIEKLKELGYTHDIFGNPLENEDQILELKPQDVILPLGGDNFAKILVKIAQFIDELLEKVYGLPRFYNVKSPEDLIGHLAIAIAPHISAGTIVRIIGFTKTQAFFAHPLLHTSTRRNCDGDELGLILLLDALINFSREFLPKKRGATQDAPLVLTLQVIPTEVDDEIQKYDTVWNYPLEFYQLAQEYTPPEVFLEKGYMEVVANRLGRDDVYFNWGFTHDTKNINYGPKTSSYKKLKSMVDKLRAQLKVAQIVRACDPAIVAKLVIDCHFAKDVKGNLRKYSLQTFRCVKCNEKYRRVPLSGKCEKCGGRLVLTVSEGTVTKYLDVALWLAKVVNLDKYTQQVLETVKIRVNQTLGREKGKQESLAKWFGKKT